MYARSPSVVTGITTPLIDDHRQAAARDGKTDLPVPAGAPPVHLFPDGHEPTRKHGFAESFRNLCVRSDDRGHATPRMKLSRRSNSVRLFGSHRPTAGHDFKQSMRQARTSFRNAGELPDGIEATRKPTRLLRPRWDAACGGQRMRSPGGRVLSPVPEHPPGAPAHSSGFTRVASTGQLLRVAVAAPFPDVPVHVKEAPRVRFLLAHLMGVMFACVPGITAKPCVIIEFRGVVAEAEPRCRSLPAVIPNKRPLGAVIFPVF